MAVRVHRHPEAERGAELPQLLHLPEAATVALVALAALAAFGLLGRWEQGRLSA